MPGLYTNGMDIVTPGTTGVTTVSGQELLPMDTIKVLKEDKIWIQSEVRNRV